MKVIERDVHTVDIDVYSAILSGASWKVNKEGLLDRIGLNRTKINGESFNKKEFVRVVSEVIKSGAMDTLPTETIIKDNRLGKEIEVTWHRGSKLSEVKHKHIVGASDNIIVSVEEVTDTLLDSNTDVMVIGDYVEFDNMFKILHDCNIKNPFLSDTIWMQTITLGNNETLFVNGNVTITADCPIEASGHVNIRGTKGSKLTLRNTDELQPCIGSLTNTGLSYGMWSTATGRCTEITIEEVEIHCETKAENFMLGEYGTDNVPRLTIEGNGSIDAIETTGRRVRSKRQTEQLASRGYTDFPEYTIRTESLALEVLDSIGEDL